MTFTTTLMSSVGCRIVLCCFLFSTPRRLIITQFFLLSESSDYSYHFVIVQSVPGDWLVTLKLPRYIFITMHLWGGYAPFHHFADEETESGRLILAPSKLWWIPLSLWYCGLAGGWMRWSGVAFWGENLDFHPCLFLPTYVGTWDLSELLNLSGLLRCKMGQVLRISMLPEQ